MQQAPENCNTMTDLRAAIDQLDSEIVALLAKRSTYIDRAARIKQQSNLPARIDARVEDVVQKNRKNAEIAGFDPDLAEALWRRIIEWSIEREETALAKAK